MVTSEGGGATGWDVCRDRFQGFGVPTPHDAHVTQSEPQQVGEGRDLPFAVPGCAARLYAAEVFEKMQSGAKEAGLDRSPPGQCGPPIDSDPAAFSRGFGVSYEHGLEFYRHCFVKVHPV